MGTPLGPKYIPYTYMDPLGMITCFFGVGSSKVVLYLMYSNKIASKFYYYKISVGTTEVPDAVAVQM